MLGKLGVQILRSSLALQLLQLRFLGHIGELLFDKVKFLLIEDVHIVTECVSILEPSMLEGFDCSQTLVRVLLKHPHHEVPCFLADCVLELDGRVQDHLVEIAHLIRFKGDVPIEHGIKADTSRPYINWVALVAELPHNLRGDVGGGSALLEEDLIINNFARDTEVCDLNVTVAIKQDVVQFDVSVDHPVVMEVGDALHDLLEYELGVFLAQLPALADVVKEIAARAELHDNQMVLISVEGLEELHDVGVPQHLEDTDLITHLFLTALVLHELHVDGLDGDQTAGKPMESQVHSPEGSLAQHLTNLVQA